jgi:hypothetical protein
MQTAFLDWLASVGSRAFTVSLGLFVLVNGVALAAFFITRDRAMVNRWTGRLLATNMVLVGTGLGVPMVTSIARLAITAMSPSISVLKPVVDKTDREAVEIERTSPIRR